jgi:hypothetical protein
LRLHVRVGDGRSTRRDDLAGVKQRIAFLRILLREAATTFVDQSEHAMKLCFSLEERALIALALLAWLSATTPWTPTPSPRG